MVTPRVTVLMPVYNAGQFLNEAIDSILKQSFKHFEFLIIDDGSTDNSAAIIESYKDPRIRFLRNDKNMGITPTLNKGILLASCELIARMDADDISHPSRLQKQYGFMKRNPEVAMLSTLTRVITDDKKFGWPEHYRSNLYYYNLTFECCMYHPTTMFRKTPVKQVGMYSEDHDLFWKVSTRFRIGNLAEPLVDCRIPPTSLNSVLRKTEYEIAHSRNVLRNIRFYMGEDFQISSEALECLRHNFRPIVNRYSLQTVSESLSALDAITEKILQKENINREAKSIRRASVLKRNFILNNLAKSLPVRQGVELLVRTHAWITLFSLMKNFLKWQLRRQANIFLSQNTGTRFKTISSQGVKGS